MPVNTPPPVILIAGAGIGGLAAALAFRRHGLRCLVFERAPELREVGAGLLLSPNAVHVLDLLGVGEAARKLARDIDEWRILDPRGRTLHRLHPTRRARAPVLSLHRADLQHLLLSRLDAADVRLGFEIASYSETDDAVRLMSVAGQVEQGEMLVGADGLRSAVRLTACSPEPHRNCGYVGWRGVTPFIPSHYHGRWLSESWGEGQRFGISPLGDRRCYWYATANTPADFASPPASRKEDLLARFAHWHPPVRDLIEATPDEAILLNPILDRPVRMRPANTTRVVLLGDAAHPMSPNLGQGACMALEDAWVLARELHRAVNPLEGLRAYARARAARNRLVSAASDLLGRVIQLEHPFSTGLRDAALRLVPTPLSDLTLRPLFSFPD